MPKRPPRNGYYYFMLDFRRREEQSGRRFPGGMVEISKAADEEWRTLPQAERDDYNEYAKQNRPYEERPNVPKKAHEKYNSLGVSFSELERQRKEKEAKEAATTTFITNFVRSKDLDNLKNDEICLIHVNVFCKTDDDLYYPAELAICKFSLEEGFLDMFHTFIDPGEIKKGYQFAVKEHSEKFHKIPLSYVQKHHQFKDYVQIFNKICNFLKMDQNKSIPLFTMNDDVYHNTSLIAVEKTLETLWDSKHSDPQKDEAWRKFFPVYPLPLLFTQLKNHCYFRNGLNQSAFPNSSLALTELNKDTYNFHTEFGCDWHQEEDAVPYCSRSYVRRWAEIIHDHCAVALKCNQTELEEMVEVESASVHGDERGDYEDDVQECDRSVVSGTSSYASARTTRSNMTETSVGFHEGASSRKEEGSTVSNASSKPSSHVSSQTSSVWIGRGRGKPRVPQPVDDENFPRLAGGKRK